MARLQLDIEREIQPFTKLMAITLPANTDTIRTKQSLFYGLQASVLLLLIEMVSLLDGQAAFPMLVLGLWETKFTGQPLYRRVTATLHSIQVIEQFSIFISLYKQLLQIPILLQQAKTIQPYNIHGVEITYILA